MVEQDDTRQRILEAAGPIFAEIGFKAATVKEICKKAGANISAVNYYFRSKEQLYIETVRYAYESAAARVPMPTWPAGTPARTKLRDFIRVFFARILSHQRQAWRTLLIMREVSDPTPGACSEFVNNFVKPTAAVLNGILQELLPADVPEVKRKLIACSIVGQCLHYHHARHVLPLLLGTEHFQEFDPEMLTEHIAEFSLAAIEGLYPSPTVVNATNRTE
jgi:AcrR family transcriptional regulator